MFKFHEKQVIMLQIVDGLRPYSLRTRRVWHVLWHAVCPHSGHHLPPMFLVQCLCEACIAIQVVGDDSPPLQRLPVGIVFLVFVHAHDELNDSRERLCEVVMILFPLVVEFDNEVNEVAAWIANRVN